MSNTFKGAQGPWKVDKNLIFSDDFFQTHIAKISPTSFDTETRKANAQLISCAPEMLEELVYIFKNESMSFEQQQQIEEAEDLITRATNI